MSARRKEQMDLRVAPEACSVAVVYDGGPARDLATEICDALVQKFVGDLEFEVTWWRFSYLADPFIAGEAAQAAAKADLILVCLQAENIPVEVQDWFERWLARRETVEGALVVGRTSGSSKTAGAATDTYLRLAAERAHLDYLPLAGVLPAPRLQDKLREDRAFSDLDDSYRPDHPYHSSGWGINE